MIKVVNFLAGPGAGKSTLAAGVFNLMKTKGHSVELVSEFAKDLTYERAWDKRNNQLVVLAEQDHRLRRLVGQVEWVLTDGPLPLCIAYCSEEYAEWLTPAIWGAFDRYENYSVLVQRTEDHPFQSYGRDQTLAEAMILDNQIGHIFDHITAAEPDFSLEVPSDYEAPYKVYEWLMDGEGEPSDG